MADGGHFENGFIAISQPGTTRFQWYLVYGRKFCSKRRARDKVSKFSKFKMADGWHIEKSFLAVSERFIVRLTEKLVQRSRITFRHRSRDHNTKFRKFQMAGGGHLKMVWSLCLSRESYCLNEICYAKSNFVPKDGHMTKYQKLSNSKVTCDSGNSLEVKRSPTACWNSFIHSFIHTGIDLRDI